MITQLKKLVEITDPKHLGHRVKKDTALYSWLLSETTHLPQNASISEKVYSVINNASNVCQYGSTQKFKSLTTGYGFCGMTKNCQCAQETISKKVAATKSKATDQQKRKTNSRRAATNLSKYGVSNSGQTKQAKQRHKETYEDKQKVADLVEKQQASVLNKYGVTNVAALKDVQNKKSITNLQKFGVTNPMQNKDIAAKSVSTKKQKYEPHYFAKQNYEKFLQTVVENFGVTPLVTAEHYLGVQSRPEITFQCIHCNECFSKRFDYASPPICKVCYPTPVNYKSNEELELLEFVKSIYSENVISGDRRVINPYEIDILLPDLNIGLEYCGLYWHSENSGKKSWNYHYRKYSAALNKNIRLITIFSDEWQSKKNTIKQYLTVVLGQQSNSVWARKCDFQLINHVDAKKFFDENHILQAPQRISWAGGLILDGSLEAVMCFRQHLEGVYELSRFATKTHVVGGASRLLKNFIKTKSPTEIFSFSDNRFSQGDIYRKLGFEQTGIVPPMQSYVENYSARHHKLAMNKRKILKSNPHLSDKLSEWQLLQSLGYDRIWDCGKIKWTLRLK